jgi:hypothetical protein
MSHLLHTISNFFNYVLLYLQQRARLSSPSVTHIILYRDPQNIYVFININMQTCHLSFTPIFLHIHPLIFLYL